MRSRDCKDGGAWAVGSVRGIALCTVAREDWREKGREICWGTLCGSLSQGEEQVFEAVRSLVPEYLGKDEILFERSN